jgi:hypothetical protein
MHLTSQSRGVAGKNCEVHIIAMIFPSRLLICIAALSIAAAECLTANDFREYPEEAALPSVQSGRLPDPRYRPAFGLWEINRVASMVARATGERLQGAVYVANDSRAPFASMRATAEGGDIVVNPRAAAEVPPNSWAFVIGHEFAHRIHGFGHRHDTGPEQELRADIIGARYALDAGFDLSAHLAWILMRPDGGSASHGSPHDRALQLAAHYRVSPQEIRMHIHRHQRFVCR